MYFLHSCGLDLYSPVFLQSRRNAGASLHLLGRPNTVLAQGAARGLRAHGQDHAPGRAALAARRAARGAGHPRGRARSWALEALFHRPVCFVMWFSVQSKQDGARMALISTARRAPREACAPAAPRGLRGRGEKDAKLAHMLGQLQPFTAVFAQERMRQFAYFGPT